MTAPFPVPPAAAGPVGQQPADRPPGQHDDPLVGRVLADRYRLLSLVGRGGMGVVYLVEHVHIGKQMAMKLLHGSLVRRREVVRRFRREAEVVSRLDHPNIVSVFDFGHSEGLAYLVMEYVAGRDFGKVIDGEGPLSFDRVARIVAQVCAGVGHAHAEGVVHRDIKPENVVIRQRREVSDQVKVLDFGLAKLRDDPEAHTLTRAGTLMGTPYYMAPEYIRGEGASPLTDVYAIGAMTYRALAGKPPFTAESSMGVLTKHLTEPVVPPSERAARDDLPPEADAVVLRAMAKDPRHRYPTVEDLRRDLLSFLGGRGEADPTLSSFGTATVPDVGVGVGGPDGQTRLAIPLATRRDVDRYERRLRWRHRLAVGASVLVLGALVSGAVATRDRWLPRAPKDQESEPNDEPATADVLEEDVTLAAYLGQRLDRNRGDADVYLLSNATRSRRIATITLSGLPNADLMFELVEAGRPRPLLVVDAGGVGAPEIAPNFPLTASRYYLRVREDVPDGAYPTENVSDTYTISWKARRADPDEEREINDRATIADLVAIGSVRRAYIGWDDDVDVFCVAADGPEVRAELEDVPPDLDLSLRMVDRAGRAGPRVDALGLGGAEVTPFTGAAARAEATCVEVSVTPGRGGGQGSNPTASYRFAFVPAATLGGVPRDPEAAAADAAADDDLAGRGASGAGRR